jgi:DNA-binding NarL/FixJ family response regulator
VTIDHDFTGRRSYNRLIVQNSALSSAKTPTRSTIRVLLAGSSPMQLQLLTAALRRRPEFAVSACSLDAEILLNTLATTNPTVLVLALAIQSQSWEDMALLRRLHISNPGVPKILLVESVDRNLVINAFRSGVRGLFCFGESPFRLLCKCIQVVQHGQIWATAQQIDYLIELVAQVPSLRVVNSNGNSLLTPREEQVVALVAEGLSNREIAQELALSEHTVKKYLFRIFDKLGISTRVELVLYAVNHGAQRPAEWLSGAV